MVDPSTPHPLYTSGQRKSNDNGISSTYLRLNDLYSINIYQKVSFRKYKVLFLIQEFSIFLIFMNMVYFILT